eukprot:m.246225 g.246225  ORF g.246225 m.246225 type:complete len:178 (+) comp26422_c0_seq6:72-605(+)
MGIEEIVDLKESTELLTDGKAVVTLEFQQALPLGWITFRNSYSATVTVRHRATALDPWTTAIKSRLLMPHPHCIEGAQDPITLSYQMVPSGAFDRVKEVQLELRQPSPHWIKFGVSHLHCFCQPDAPIDDSTLQSAQPSSDVGVRLSSQTHVHTLTHTLSLSLTPTRSLSLTHTSLP